MHIPRALLTPRGSNERLLANFETKNPLEAPLKYGVPTRTEVEGNVAYIAIPTVYNYKEMGRAMTEKGRMTFVLHTKKDTWKIA
jgi:hypothetical protein